MAGHLTANASISKTLRPCREDSVDFDSTENLYIEGDNLDVLKLLRETYLGKIKMIYIDPPYNTGNDFIYNDDFAEDADEYREKSGQFDDDGARLVKNVESNGRYHSDWLNMIYPRLRLARDLLTDDGVIFISIDDNEVENLKKCCDDIFGEKNFIAQIIVQSNKRGQTYKELSKTHEYLLAYTKSDDYVLNELEKKDDDNDLNLVDEIGNFNIRELRNRNPKFGRFNRPNLFYPIYVKSVSEDKDGFYAVSLKKSDEYCIEIFPYNSTGQESCWRWGKKLVEENATQETQRCNLVAKQKKTAVITFTKNTEKRHTNRKQFGTMFPLLPKRERLNWVS